MTKTVTLIRLIHMSPLVKCTTKLPLCIRQPVLTQQGGKMIRDVEVQVSTTEGTFTLTVTGQQIGQTIERRMKTIMPKARILDMTEKNGEQGDLMTRAAKVTK